MVPSLREHGRRLETQALSICKAHFKLKLSRPATLISFSPSLITVVCALSPGETTTCLACSLHQFDENRELAAVVLLRKDVRDRSSRSSSRGLYDALTAASFDWSRRSRGAIVRSSSVAVRPLSRETAGWRLGREIWPAVDNFVRGRETKLATAIGRRIRSRRSRAIRPSRLRPRDG